MMAEYINIYMMTDTVELKWSVAGGAPLLLVMTDDCQPSAMDDLDHIPNESCYSSCTQFLQMCFF